jgi:hypothetical protein
MPIRVGYYCNWDKSTPEVCYIPAKSNENKRKKCFDPVTASSLAKTYKDAEFYVDFLNINLP